MTRPPRETDRWVTPRVIVVLLVVGCVIVLGAMGSVTFLAAIGVDPSPMLDVVSKVGTLVASLAALLVQLANRRTVAKVERNTGTTPSADDVADAVADRLGPPPEYPPTGPLYGLHAAPRSRPAPAPPGS